VYSETGDSIFTMPAVLSGDKKESIFLLSFQPTAERVPDGHIINPVKVFITYKIVKTGEIIEEECVLQIPVINENVEIESIELDEDVMVNFYRVKAAAMLKEAAEFGERNEMESARNLLQQGANELKNCVVSNNEIVNILITDLENAQNKFVNKQVWDHGGKAEISSKYRSHYNKRGEEVDAYQNSCQKKNED